MSPRFCPRLDSLEARDVPAAFSAALPDGTIVSGLFSTPAGVDAAVDDQWLDAPDLVAQAGGTAFDASSFTSTPTAHYSYGQLIGVDFVMDDPNGAPYTLVTVGDNQAAITPTGGSTEYGEAVFDGADTMATFTLPDGTTGSLSYTVPWDQVDSSQAGQSLTPTAFNLNIAGQNFAYGSANFTAAPTLQFANGAFQGVTFTLDTSAVSGFAYTSFAASVDTDINNVVSNVMNAVKVGVGPLDPSLINVKQPQAVLYFNIGANDTKDTVLPTGTRIRIHIEARFGDDQVITYDYDGTTIEGETVGDIAFQVQSNMAASGWDVSLSPNGKYIVVNGKKQQNNTQAPVTAAGINYSGMTQPVGLKTAGQVELLVLQADGTWTPFES